MFKMPTFRKDSTEQLIFTFVLKPLNEAYTMAKRNKKIVYYDENTITEIIVWHLKYDTSLSYSYRKGNIYIELRPKEQYTIDDIYEPDIKITFGTLRMEIESKRIYGMSKWSTSDYLSKDKGIGRFLWGVYSHNEKYGGMIGYIQKGDFQKIIKKIKAGLKKINCKKCENITKIENCMLSIHYRDNKEDIRIYHLFFYFS
ncbi:MAG: hypothetical protein HXS48_26285 [Theionarchaea archaeon]|nr:MAG: hypothetical protein AYK19_22100 [Theionarchaea archaeon DG-70-1]MBU7030468.1 hypothetical protein [Theionarchaea archaeon]